MELIDMIEKYLINKQCFNIAIAGCTCSGKTTLSNEIKDLLSKSMKVSIIDQDAYYKNLENIPTLKGRYLLDSINAFETREFVNDVESLLKNKSIMVPTYDINSNTRISKDKIITMGDINIFEGLHVIRLLNHLDIYKIFINTPLDICLERRVNRDQNKYNAKRDSIEKYFEDYIIPMYSSYGLPQKKQADLVINNEMEGKCLLKKLSKN